METINIGPTSLNCGMVFQAPTATRGELYLTDLPKLGLFLVGESSCLKLKKLVVKGIAICVRSCIGIPRHVICRFEHAAFASIADIQSEGWRIRNLLTFRMC